MDPEQLKQFADVQFERAAYIKSLRESIKARLTTAHNGGLFTVDLSLITFLSVRTEDQLIIEDMYNNPVKIQRQALLNQARKQYDEVMAEWHSELESSNQIRRAEHV
jgi:hypothetical protein